MKEFTEYHHAFIAASFYKELTEYFGKQGEKVFIMAVQKYAEQRGARMAQRALRDNKELTFTSYKEYGEWSPSSSLTEAGKTNSVKEVSLAPDYEIEISQCPWATQFKKMGLEEGGKVYCTHLDKGIVRGFNPYLVFEVPQTMYGEYSSCIQIMKGADFEKDQKFIRDPKNIKGFDYHCGHIYKTFKEISTAIFKISGEEIALKVLKSFQDEYGKEMGEVLLSYLKTDFNLI